MRTFISFKLFCYFWFLFYRHFTSQLLRVRPDFRELLGCWTSQVGCPYIHLSNSVKSSKGISLKHVQLCMLHYCILLYRNVTVFVGSCACHFLIKGYLTCWTCTVCGLCVGVMSTITPPVSQRPHTWRASRDTQAKCATDGCMHFFVECLFTRL